jgi:hypothetical protein
VDAVREFGIFDLTVLSEANGITSDERFKWSTSTEQHKISFFNLTKQELEFLANLPPNDPNAFLRLARVH